MTLAPSMTSRLRTTIAILLLVLASSASALPREARVPGGIALLPLHLPSSAPAPQATFAGQAVLVTHAEGQWLALVGLPLDLAPGDHALHYTTDKGAHEIHFTVSIGASVLQVGEQDSLQQALKRADEALYQAKRQGRDQACFA